MTPVLLITTRAEDDVASEEYAAYARLTGLAPAELEWRRAEQAPLGAVDVTRYSGIILAGSPYTVSDPIASKSATELRVEHDLAALLDEVVRRDVPFLGVCYGIGTIGVHQGARVDRRYGESSRATTVRVTPEGRRDPLFRDLPAEFDAFVGHKEAISEVPAGIVVLASSAACPVQALRVGRNAYATQFHPELDRAAFADRVRSYADHGYFDPASLGTILADVEHADVRASHLILRRFAAVCRAPIAPATAVAAESSIAA